MPLIPVVCVCVCVLPACLKSEAGVFLSGGRAGVTVEMTGLPLPGDGTDSNSQENKQLLLYQ